MKKESKPKPTKGELLAKADELIRRTGTARGLDYKGAVEFLQREDPAFLEAVLRVSKSKGG